MRNELFEFEGELGSRLVGKLDLPGGPLDSYALLLSQLKGVFF